MLHVSYWNGLICKKINFFLKAESGGWIKWSQRPRREAADAPASSARAAEWTGCGWRSVQSSHFTSITKIQHKMTTGVILISHCRARSGCFLLLLFRLTRIPDSPGFHHRGGDVHDGLCVMCWFSGTLQCCSPAPSELHWCCVFPSFPLKSEFSSLLLLTLNRRLFFVHRCARMLICFLIWILIVLVKSSRRWRHHLQGSLSVNPTCPGSVC